MTPFVLMIALGVHATFEGIAVGISDKMTDVETMMIAIFLHKGAAGMSLGISMAKTFPDNPKLIYALLTLFAVFTPLGVVLGWALSSEAENDMMEIVFTCLAAGTFLYISCQEIISEEFGNSKNRYWKFLFYLLGIAMIGMLFLLDTDDDDN